MVAASPRSLAVFLTLIAIPSGTRSADAPPDGPEQAVLDKCVGKWRNTYKVPKAEWTPQEKSGTADVSAVRAVGGRFVEEKSEHSDGTSTMRVLTYDPQRKCYRGWYFSSAGQTAETTGKWDGDSKTMTWTSVGEAAFTTTVVNRFVDDDHANWDVTVKDGTDTTLFRMEGTSVRVKGPK
jgi:hypothetical protein